MNRSQKQKAFVSLVLVRVTSMKMVAITAREATRATTKAFSNSSTTSACRSKSTVPQEQNYSPIFVAATKEHVGKTSVSLALMSGLVKRFGRHHVGFMKPVGQKFLQVDEPMTVAQGRDGGARDPQENDNDQGVTFVKRDVDKDAVLIKSHFGLDHLSWSDTSPVLIPPGYTKSYLDGNGGLYQDQIDRIRTAYTNVLSAQSDIVLCEGTGHCAVGSIIDVSNADVASLLGAKMVLVANAGLGNTFDELNLNRNWCLERNVPIAGIIINQIQSNKYEQTVSYLTKAIHQKWGKDYTTSTDGTIEGDIPPLLGCIPDRPFLGCAALCDLERLFGATIITGKQHSLKHYRIQDISLVATSLEVFLKHLRNNNGGRTLFVCHASRTDILLGYLMESIQRMTAATTALSSSIDANTPETTEVTTGLRCGDIDTHNNTISSGGSTTSSSSFNDSKKYEPAMIITGCNDYPISTQVLEIITSLPIELAPPVLLTDLPTDVVVSGLYKYTPKLNIHDQNRVTTAIAHYEPYINFDLLLDRVRINDNNNDNNKRSLCNVDLNHVVAKKQQ